MQDVNHVLFNIGAGIFYYTDKFYIGASFPKLIDNKIDYPTEEIESYLKPTQNPYFITSGYVFQLKEIKLKPSVLIKHLKDNQITVDYNFNALLKDMVGVGVSYRSNKSFGAMLELYLSDKYRLGYAYHLSTSEIRSYNSGTHEIMFGFCFRKEIVSYQSPRYF